MPKIADKYFLTDPWKIIEQDFDTNYSRVAESIFSLANENIGVRGCFDELSNVNSLRGMYVNGIYENEELPKSYKGIIDKAHFMIPTADWLRSGISIDGEQLDLAKSKVFDFSRELDMRTGTLTRSFVWHTNSGKDLKLTFLRFLDMTHNERAYQRIEIESLNFSGTVQISSGISFNVTHEGRNACLWEAATRIQPLSDKGTMAIMSRTKSSKLELFAAAALSVDGEKVTNICETTTPDDKSVFAVFDIELEQAKPATFDKLVVIVFEGLSGDALWQAGLAKTAESMMVSTDEALAQQKQYWAKHWEHSDVIIEPSQDSDKDAVAEEQQGIRYCIFQMTQTYTGGSVRHNIGAKGLTGEAYNGHAFWDTEACCLPFYLFTNIDAARCLLMFRYNTLPQAIERAKMLDCEGACYPIATLNGEEACNLWQHASLQFQPSTAVAYGIWHYVKTTGDTDFLFEYGAEILVQISRFLVSRAGQNPHTGKYGYYGVMGPDEFKMMVNNNAYTNYMAKRTLEYAHQTLSEMKSAAPKAFAILMDKTRLNESEIGHWREMADNMAMNMTEDGIIEQHDGYFDLPHIDIHSIPTEEFPLYSHWSYDRIYRTDMIKQPDVLMFLYLYNSSFSEDVKRANYDYYEPRTIHESSLSPSVHSILAAELGYMDAATEFFGFATRLDLDNYNRNTCEGLHTTSIAMAWINIVYGFAGLRSDGEMLGFAPRLPERWSSLRFSLSYQGRVIEIHMQNDKTTFTLLAGEPLDISIYGKTYTLETAIDAEI